MQFDHPETGMLGGSICILEEGPPHPFADFEGSDGDNLSCSLCTIKLTSEQKNCPSMNAIAWAEKQYADSGYVPDANLVNDVEDHLRQYVQAFPESPVEMKNLKRSLIKLKRKDIHRHFSLHVQPSAQRVYDEQIRIWRTLQREVLSDTCTRNSDTGQIIVHPDKVKLLNLICSVIRQLCKEQKMFSQKDIQPT